MRRIYRPDIRLPSLVKITDWREHQNAKGKFKDLWNTPDVRGALLAMHGMVCSYCLCPLSRSDRGDVEHFRPKSIYNWLAYRFDNYFLSCLVCNRQRKRSAFPVKENRIATKDEEVADEPRLLIDPNADTELESWMRINLASDELDVEVNLLETTKKNLEYERTETTISFYRLNRDMQLVKLRINAIDKFIELLSDAKKGGLETSQESKLRMMLSRRSPFGGHLRQILRDLDTDGLLAEKWVPSELDEQCWLLVDLIDEEQLCSRLLGKKGTRKEKSKLGEIREELVWAMSVLLYISDKDDRLEELLDKAGLTTEVEQLMVQLTPSP